MVGGARWSVGRGGRWGVVVGGARWSVGLGGRWGAVIGGAQWSCGRASGFRSKGPFRSLVNFVHPTLPVSFGRDIKSPWSLPSGEIHTTTHGNTCWLQE